jgi:catechol-2,3-dioxygenase
MQQFDRAAEDLGNSIHLEHVNVQVPDQRLAQLFYAAGLGLTRDPYLMVADTNMWINVGRSQFHLPTGKAQVVRGHTGLVIAGRAALLDRLTRVKPKLDGTKFGFAEHNDYVEATCPWGNRVRCYEPDAERFGRIALGIPYVEFDVPVGAAQGIVKYYRHMIDVPAEVVNGDGTTAKVTVGKNQHLLFRETDKPLPDYDEHHVQIYVVNFSGPHRRLSERGLVNREDNQYQYRFRDIVDLDSGRHLFTIEHEVRSLTHPMCLRPLVNRNPEQTARNYANGYDQVSWAMEPLHYDDQQLRRRMQQEAAAKAN